MTLRDREDMCTVQLCAHAQTRIITWSVMSNLERYDSFIRRSLLVERKSYEDISRALRYFRPNTKGLSARNIRRYCADNGICAISRPTDEDLDEIVKDNIEKVYNYYNIHSCIIYNLYNYIIMYYSPNTGCG